MDHRARKLALLAVLSACFTTLVTTALAVEPEAEPAPPPADASCARWQAYHRALIAYHERARGLDPAARDRATDEAYAQYGQCVMGGCDEKLVARRETLRLVLMNGRSVAAADPAQPIAAR